MNAGKQPEMPRDRNAVFVLAPLYTSYSVQNWNDEDLSAFLFGGGTVDAWCLQCDKESTFHLKDQSKTRELPTSTEKPRRILLDEVVIVEASCTRESTSPYAIRRYQVNRCGFPFVCIMLKHQRIITKIGQSPSAFSIEKRRITRICWLSYRNTTAETWSARLCCMRTPWGLVHSCISEG